MHLHATKNIYISQSLLTVQFPNFELNTDELTSRERDTERLRESTNMVK